MVQGGLLHGPFPGLRIVAGQGEAMPIGVIQLRMIGPVVIPRPPRFLPEQGVLGHTLRSQDPVLKLPRPHQLVQAVGPEMGGSRRPRWITLSWAWWIVATGPAP